MKIEDALLTVFPPGSFDAKLQHTERVEIIKAINRLRILLRKHLDAKGSTVLSECFVKITTSSLGTYPDPEQAGQNHPGVPPPLPVPSQNRQGAKDIVHPGTSDLSDTADRKPPGKT